MGLLDEVAALKNKGFSEQQIINKLQESGNSPKEIKDALGRAQIKNAVSSQDNKTQELEASIMTQDPQKQKTKKQNKQTQQQKPYPGEGELQPPAPISKIKKENYMPSTQEINQGQQTQEIGNTEQNYQESGQAQQAQQESPQQTQDYQGYEEYASQIPSPNQEYYPQEQYDTGYGYDYASMTDTDTMIEIAEQVFTEKMKKTLKQVDELTEFKTLAESKIENISDRLKRIESQIDNLQITILEKIGSYGRGIDTVKKEMKMVEDSFEKVMSGLSAEKTHKKSKKTTKRKSKSKKSHSKSKKKKSKKSKK